MNTKRAFHTLSDDALIPVGEDARPWVGGCRSMQYRWLREGSLRAVKVGKRTYLTGESINRRRLSLPRYQPQKKECEQREATQ